MYLKHLREVYDAPVKPLSGWISKLTRNLIKCPCLKINLYGRLSSFSIACCAQATSAVVANATHAASFDVSMCPAKGNLQAVVAQQAEKHNVGEQNKMLVLGGAERSDHQTVLTMITQKEVKEQRRGGGGHNAFTPAGRRVFKTHSGAFKCTVSLCK